LDLRASRSGRGVYAVARIGELKTTLALELAAWLLDQRVLRQSWQRRGDNLVTLPGFGSLPAANCVMLCNR
jgi:hypothetical protein